MPGAILAVMPQPPKPDAAILARVRKRLADRIELTGISISRLASRSGVAKTTIYRLLRKDDEGDVYLGTLANLAAVLLIDVHELLDPLPDEGGQDAEG